MTARCIPAVAPSDIDHEPERTVYEALQQLPDGFVVLHSFPWLRPLRNYRNEPLSEGEADFIVMHPERGLLVVEVKGGEPYLRDRTWYRGKREIRDPFEQARRNRYALLAAVEERTSRRVHRDLFPHGDLVVFPGCRYEGDLPLNADARIFVDQSGLTEMTARVLAAYASWERQPKRLSKQQFDLVLDALLPQMRLLRCIGAELLAERTRIVQVTKEQQATLQGLLASDRVIVEGGAGSGKTLLAFEFAVVVAQRGHRVLVLCFNRHLATWLQERVGIETRLVAGSVLEVSTFHAYAVGLARRANIEFAIDPSNKNFWDEEVPLVLEQALDVLRLSGRAPEYDVVVVDEAQDFAPDWWVTVESLTVGGRTGRLYAFLDLHQSLRAAGELPPVPLPTRFRLGTNCRNTKAIARGAAALARAEVTILPAMPEGETPSVRRAPSSPSGAGLAMEEVRRLLREGIQPEQIALIGPSSRERGSLSNVSELEDVPLVSDAAAWRTGAGVLLTTARAFKGLEADIVVLYDLSGFGALFTKTDLYVAWTRARHRLVIVCIGPEVRAAVEAALAACECPDTKLPGSRLGTVTSKESP